MRIVLIFATAVVAALAAANFSTATQAKAGCRADLITVMDWDIRQIEPEPRLRMNMDVTIRLDAEKPIRMIDGSITFADALGRSIGTMGIAPDTNIAPGEESTLSSVWGRHTFERLLDMDPADVMTETCVDGLVYGDGEVAKFTD